MRIKDVVSVHLPATCGREAHKGDLAIILVNFSQRRLTGVVVDCLSGLCAVPLFSSEMIHVTMQTVNVLVLVLTFNQPIPRVHEIQTIDCGRGKLFATRGVCKAVIWVIFFRICQCMKIEGNSQGRAEGGGGAGIHAEWVRVPLLTIVPATRAKESRMSDIVCFLCAFVRLCVCVSAGGITHGSSPASHENVGHQSTFEERTLLTRPRSGLGKNPPPTAVCIRRPPSRYLEHENRM